MSIIYCYYNKMDVIIQSQICYYSQLRQERDWSAKGATGANVGGVAVNGNQNLIKNLVGHHVCR